MIVCSNIKIIIILTHNNSWATALRLLWLLSEKAVVGDCSCICDSNDARHYLIDNWWYICQILCIPWGCLLSPTGCCSGKLCTCSRRIWNSSRANIAYSCENTASDESKDKSCRYCLCCKWSKCTRLSRCSLFLRLCSLLVCLTIHIHPAIWVVCRTGWCVAICIIICAWIIRLIRIRLVCIWLICIWLSCCRSLRIWIVALWIAFSWCIISLCSLLWLIRIVRITRHCEIYIVCIVICTVSIICIVCIIHISIIVIHNNFSFRLQLEVYCQSVFNLWRDYLFFHKSVNYL